MNAEENHKKLEESICWANSPPAPVPGMCYIEPQIKRDFTSFDGSLEKVVPRQLYTDLLDAMDIDFMGMVIDHIEGTTRSIGHTNKALRDLEKRTEALERERIKESVSRIFDYQKYIQESFEDVEDTIVHPMDSNIKVEEAYSLFPGHGEEHVIIQSDNIDFQKSSFSILEEESSQLFRKACMSDGRAFACLPQRVDDFLVLYIKNGNAYYGEVSALYKLQEPRKQKKQEGRKKEG
ncbi:hypothetical protein EHEL_070640 [Encephalitozoon hellem ATCC 50504]|uniref:Uncharacterized protein n=1 Tax=Encephalitozoon hellem TaxID=27973 RepID=A0A9Q9C8P4_ENCHE|nr:uncharacterized protein EHEL_070640 [Encephalitozoon hellem ATCC 50504]AFM98591.1 hypothetical protein EHEL_070640 [Encephalitozoon hellem ATCC 50504]UTX43535.1 hypothetical protein GPU96_07g12940 [Encephalitozoon hellem]WEL39009.1 hypothetical protein PFJ87_07g00860 [Encephalitozoon hellem]|eukprot:XP_003887572.1 hypothetical protein EHEL_070640 [Encephalitozoon hellem ATCC 50504]